MVPTPETKWYSFVIFLYPEFVNGRRVQGVVAYLFDSPKCPYNIFYGCDFLSQIGLKMSFENNCIQWLDTILDRKNIRFYDGFLEDVEDIGLQPNQSTYLQYLNAFHKERDDIAFDNFIHDDTWDTLGRRFSNTSTKR